MFVFIDVFPEYFTLRGGLGGAPAEHTHFHPVVLVELLHAEIVKVTLVKAP